MTVIQPEFLLTTREVAAAFGVDPQTVTRWARAGKLLPLRTLGGHRRYRQTEIRALLANATAAADHSSAPTPQPGKDDATTAPDVITRARLNALGAALTAHGLRVRIGTDALTVRNPTPGVRDTSPNPGHYQAITPAPDQSGTPTWHWARTEPGPDTPLQTCPIAPVDDIDTTAVTIARALGAQPSGQSHNTPDGQDPGET